MVQKSQTTTVWMVVPKTLVNNGINQPTSTGYIAGLKRHQQYGIIWPASYQPSGYEAADALGHFSAQPRQAPREEAHRIDGWMD